MVPDLFAATGMRMADIHREALTGVPYEIIRRGDSTLTTPDAVSGVVWYNERTKQIPEVIRIGRTDFDH